MVNVSKIIKKVNRDKSKKPKYTYTIRDAMSFDASKIYLKKKERWYKQSDYPLAKWILFCNRCLKKGIIIRLYPAQSTVSKYIYLCKSGKVIKIRFSNHKPNRKVERTEDCDYYVGISNNNVCTSEEIFKQVIKDFDI